MLRLAILLAAGVCMLAAWPVCAGELSSGPRPVKPRSGAVFNYARALPRITFSWKESGQGSSYILQVTRVSGPSSEVATYLVKGSNSYTFQVQKDGKFRWWVASIGHDGKPSRPGPARYFKVFPSPAPKAAPPELVRIKPEQQPVPKEPPPPKVVKAEPPNPEPARNPFEFPAAPLLQAPNQGARIVTAKPRQVLLFWKPVSRASSYEVVLGASRDLTGTVTRKVVKGSMMALPKPAPGSTFWRVRALNAAGQTGDWSVIWKFDYQVHGLLGD